MSRSGTITIKSDISNKVIDNPEDLVQIMIRMRGRVQTIDMTKAEYEALGFSGKGVTRGGSKDSSNGISN